MQTLALLFALATAACAIPYVDRRQSWSEWNAQTKAVYVISNSPSGNEVIAMAVDEQGHLSGGRHFITGGIGGNYVSPATGKALFPDSLSGQDALVRVADYIFVVNAGSNTVAMFKISNKDATSLELLGSPKPSQGEFPTTLAVSKSLQMVCVGSTGAVSGVACSHFDDSGLSGFDALRKLDSPTGPVPGISDVLFSEDGSKLIAMIKGNGTTFTGYTATFPVDHYGVGRTATRITPPVSAVLFGTSTIPGSSDILVSDAGFGALVLNLNDLSAQPIGITNVTGQKASCWAGVSSSGRGFITDASVNRLIEVDVSNGAVVKEYYPPTPFNAMTDFQIVGNHLWALSASNGSYPTSVTTFDIGRRPGDIQFVSAYAVPGADGNAQGLVVF